MCHNLVNQIEAKSSNINIERVWNNPQPDITIKYRNVDEIHFRVVAENWEAAMKRKRGNPQWLDNNERAGCANSDDCHQACGDDGGFRKFGKGKLFEDHFTLIHRRFSADCSTASSTCWFFNPSSKVGCTAQPLAMAFTKSATVCTKVCS